MQPTRADAMFAVQQVVLGERPADAPEVLAALAAFPELGNELRELVAVQRQLHAPTDDAAGIEAEARAAVTAHDARLVQRLIAPQPPRRHWLLALAAALLVGIAFAVWSRLEHAPDDGMLEPLQPVHIDRTGATWSIDPGVQLPPGHEYRVTLEIDGRPALAPQAFSCPIQLPAAWQQELDRAASAALLVELPELSARRRVPLR